MPLVFCPLNALILAMFTTDILKFVSIYSGISSPTKFVAGILFMCSHVARGIIMDDTGSKITFYFPYFSNRYNLTPEVSKVL